MVGKYVSLPDAYLSIIEALYHAGVANGVHAEVHLIDGEELNAETRRKRLAPWMESWFPVALVSVLSKERSKRHAMPAKTTSPSWAFAGLQAAVCEFARNVAGLAGATSAEFDESADYTVIDLMPEQEDVEDKGGTMRLGAYPCKLEKGPLAMRCTAKKLSTNAIAIATR